MRGLLLRWFVFCAFAQTTPTRAFFPTASSDVLDYDWMRHRTHISRYLSQLRETVEFGERFFAFTSKRICTPFLASPNERPALAAAVPVCSGPCAKIVEIARHAILRGNEEWGAGYAFMYVRSAVRSALAHLPKSVHLKQRLVMDGLLSAAKRLEEVSDELAKECNLIWLTEIAAEILQATQGICHRLQVSEDGLERHALERENPLLTETRAISIAFPELVRATLRLQMDRKLTKVERGTVVMEIDGEAELPGFTDVVGVRLLENFFRAEAATALVPDMPEEVRKEVVERAIPLPLRLARAVVCSNGSGNAILTVTIPWKESQSSSLTYFSMPLERSYPSAKILDHLRVLKDSESTWSLAGEGGCPIESAYIPRATHQKWIYPGWTKRHDALHKAGLLCLGIVPPGTKLTAEVPPQAAKSTEPPTAAPTAAPPGAPLTTRATPAPPPPTAKAKRPRWRPLQKGLRKRQAALQPLSFLQLAAAGGNRLRESDWDDEYFSAEPDSSMEQDLWLPTFLQKSQQISEPVDDVGEDREERQQRRLTTTPAEVPTEVSTKPAEKNVFKEKPTATRVEVVCGAGDTDSSASSGRSTVSLSSRFQMLTWSKPREQEGEEDVAKKITQRQLQPPPLK